MKKKFLIAISILVGVALLNSACGANVEPTPTTDPEVIMTEVAMTVEAEITQAALLTPSATATVAPTATLPMVATQDLSALTTQQSSAIPTVAMTLPAAAGAATQPVVTTADNAEWVEDVTVEDGDIFYENEYFKKVWKVKNTGSTTWDATYSLVNIDGNNWKENVIVPLTTTVTPGSEVNLAVECRAPLWLG